LKLKLQLKLKQTPWPGTGNCAGLFHAVRREGRAQGGVRQYD
jgi:hypothetical protein